MKKMSAANKRFYLVLGIIGVLLVSWLGWGLLGPKPLGDRLELVNRTYSGYIPFISDSDFSIDYYYATDMSLDELTAYFKSARLTKPPQTEQDARQVSFTNLKNNRGFTLLYYNYEKAKHRTPLKTGKNLVIVSDEHYDAAKDSL